MSGADDCLNVFAKNAGLLVADIVRAFDSSDIKLLSVTFSSPSLDDVFLKHTGHRIRTEDLVKAPSSHVWRQTIMTLLSDTWYIFVRYLKKLVRNPILLFFSLFQPVIFLLLFTQLLGRFSDIPGFVQATGTVVMQCLRLQGFCCRMRLGQRCSLGIVLWRTLIRVICRRCL